MYTKYEKQVNTSFQHYPIVFTFPYPSIQTAAFIKIVWDKVGHLCILSMKDTNNLFPMSSNRYYVSLSINSNSGFFQDCLDKVGHLCILGM